MVESLKVEVALEGAEKLQQQFHDIGVAGREAFAGIASAAAKFSAAMAAVSAAAAIGAIKKLIDFAEAAGETEKALTKLQKVSGQTFASLSSLQQVFAAGGTSLKEFAAAAGTLSEKIAEAGQQARIRKADAATVQWANDIDLVRGKVDRLDLAFSPLTTSATKVQAILESLAKLPASEQWYRLADIIKNLGSDMERAQIGRALGLSPAMIATLKQGSEALRQMAAEAQRLGLTLTTSNQTALQQMAQQWNQFTGLLSAIFEKIGALAAPAFGQLLQIASGVAKQIVLDFQNMPIEQAIANLGPRLVAVFKALGELLSPIATAIGKAFLDSLMAALTPTTSLFDAIFEDFRKFGESLVANAVILGEKIKSALGLSGGGSAGGGGGGLPMAGGGLMGGRGTGTSDSNLAWLSRGEHVMPALAVRQPGVLAFLEALRRSGGNLSRVLDGMGRFALGGMVAQHGRIPAFAAGGMVGGGKNLGTITLAMGGQAPVSGLVDVKIAEALGRVAVKQQFSGTGRKPAWYK